MSENDDIKYVSPSKFEVLFREFDTTRNVMRTTEAMNLNGGVLIRTSTEQKEPGGSISEALAFVPNMKIVTDNGNIYRLIPR